MLSQSHYAGPALLFPVGGRNKKERASFLFLCHHMADDGGAGAALPLPCPQGWLTCPPPTEIAALCCLGEVHSLLFYGLQPRRDTLGGHRALRRNRSPRYQHRFPHGCFRATDPDMVLDMIRGVDITMNLSGNQDISFSNK